MTRIRRAAPLLILAAACAGAAGGRGKPKREAGTMEWNGAFCQVASPSYRIVHSAGEWIKLWEDLGSPAPKADLKSNFAVAVFAGARNTGGYGIRFEKPVETPSKFTVRYLLTLPPKDGMVIQTLTQPYAVRLYPRKEKAIAVEALIP